jgi:cytochrome b561
MTGVDRYHRRLVVLHWTLAALIVAMLAAGFLVLALLPTADPRVGIVLRWHLVGGAVILVLMIARVVVRLREPRPAKATTGTRWLDWLIPVSHYGFYILIFLTIAAGATTAVIANLLPVLFLGSGEGLPPDFMVYPSFQAHGLLATILANLVILHVLAVCYHQFFRRDGLLARMSLGSPQRGRSSAPPAPSGAE